MGRIIAAIIIAISIGYLADQITRSALIISGYTHCIERPITKDSWCKGEQNENN